MSLDEVIPDASLERLHYHTLPQKELEKLSDAEALHERARRYRLAISLPKNEDVAWRLYMQSARLGHSIALAFCLHFGRGASVNIARAVALYRESAERGHPVGIVHHSREDRFAA
jgi:TPR repeat protein